VGFTTIFNQFVVLFVNPFRLKNVRSIEGKKTDKIFQEKVLLEL
jgi:hypothetical protein